MSASCIGWITSGCESIVHSDLLSPIYILTLDPFIPGWIQELAKATRKNNEALRGILMIIHEWHDSWMPYVDLNW